MVLNVAKRKREKSQRLRFGTFLYQANLTLGGLLPALGPPLLHGIGNALASLRAQFALPRSRWCGGSNGATILASFGTSTACTYGRSRRSREQRARLLQF
jgi:hypothetical protein